MAEIPRKWLTLGLRRKSPLDIFRNGIIAWTVVQNKT